MKILIIHSPRSGSTNLLNTISECGKFNKYDEPWMGWYSNLDYKNIKSNCIVKSCPIDKPNDFNGTHIEFYNYLIPKFDKVLLLSRKDKESQLESFTYGEEYSNGNWHQPYNFDKIYYSKFKFYKKKWNRFLVSINDLIEYYSKELSIDITYYEDLYYGDDDFKKKFLKNINISENKFIQFKKLLDTKGKYRKDGT